MATAKRKSKEQGDRKSVQKDQHEQFSDQDEENEEIPPPLHRIFLYFQLQTIRGLPHTKGRLTIELQQSKNTLTKLEDHFTTDTTIDLSQFPAYKPTFSIAILQDDVEDLNILCDNPLIITLYEYIKSDASDNDAYKSDISSTIQLTGRTEPTERTEVTSQLTSQTEPGNHYPDQTPELSETLEKEQSEESGEEYKNPIGQGHIDLIKFFTKRRELSNVSCFIYPIKRGLISSAHTCITEWQVYSLFPLLKEIAFYNLCYFSFESIFNPRPELLDNAEYLVATISFQSTIPNKDKQYDKIELCTFDQFYNCASVKTNNHYIWQTMKDKELRNYSCLGIRTGAALNVNKTFRNLVLPENCDHKILSSNPLNNPKVSCNATHRFSLTENLIRILEDVLAFNEQCLLIELSHSEYPDEILMRGTINLSILLYPKVNSARFFVKLDPVNVRSSKAKNSLSRGPLNTKRTTNTSDAPQTFAILSICLLMPITEIPNAISSKKGISTLKTRKHQKMHKYDKSKNPAHCYKDFNGLIREIINYIIKHQVKSIDDAKNILCCQKENLTNRILKLVASDFNTRFPTTSNIEFHNLMTIVYTELVHRVYDILKGYDDTISGQFPATPESEIAIVHLLSSAKYLDEIGDSNLSLILRNKALTMDKGNFTFGFNDMICNLERKNFEKVREYLKNKLEENSQSAVIMELMEIYVNYVEKLANEETYNAGMEYLIDALRNLLIIYPRQLAVWVLLHCLFKHCGYLPGITYTRLRYEALLDTEEIKIPLIANSLWDIYLPYTFRIPASLRNTLFYRSFKMMNRLGLYKFAQYILPEFQADCTPFEKYMIETMVKILLNEVPQKYPARLFPLTKGKSAEDAAEEKAFQASINGHLEYSRGEIDAALAQYKSILQIEGLNTINFFSLAILRFATKMYEYGKYEVAEAAFTKVNSHSVVSLVSRYGAGKAVYELNLLNDAETNFSYCTLFHIHIPDVWAYLALINFRKQMKQKALECWKYAKLNEVFDVSDELLQKLNEIKCSDMTLTIDEPVQKL